MKNNTPSKVRNLFSAFGSPKLFCLLAMAFLLCSVEAAAQQKTEKGKLGKIFIKAATTEVEGQQIPDAEREDSVKDMKKRPGKFILADEESEADFLIVINERNSTPQSGNPSAKSLLATLYVRESGEWKPATILKSGSNNIFWSVAAENIIKKAASWVKENARN
jgi:hypothetical protein